MSEFFATRQDSDQARIDAALAPEESPGFWDKPFENVWSGDVAAGIARAGEGANQFLINAGRWASEGGFTIDPQRSAAGVAALADPAPRDNWWENHFREHRDALADIRRERTIDPSTRSEAANLIGGVSGTLATFFSAGLVGGPAGAVTGPVFAGQGYGRESYETLRAEGLSHEEALGGASIEGGFMTVMGALPVALPGRILTRAASGAGINTAFGVGMRGSMREYLQGLGYDDLAEQYQWFDNRAMTIDAVLGVAFGVAFGRQAPQRVRPHSSSDGEAEVGSPTLPEDADGFFEEARQYGTDEQYAEAYAYALVAREMGHAEADGLVALIEEDASAADLDAGRAIAEEITATVPGDLRAAAIVEADTIGRETAFGVPVDHASARFQAEAMARMEAQAARDEAIDPGPAPEGVDFVPLPGADPEFEQAFLAAMRDGGVSEAEARLNELRGEANARGIPPDMLASFGARARGVDPWRGNERFEDARLTQREAKVVEMARNNYSNAEIAEEMDITTRNVSVTINKAKKKIPGLVIRANRNGAPPGINPRTYEPTATIQEIVALHNKLHRQGYRNRLGNPAVGRRNINTIVGERLGLTAGNVTKRLFDYRRDLAAGRIEGEPLSSLTEGEGALVEELQSVAEQTFGADWAALANAGRVEIVPSHAALAERLRAEGKADRAAWLEQARPGAIHLRDTKRTYFVADAIGVADMRGLILHEIGVHKGMADLLGKKGLGEVYRQIERMIADGHPTLSAAREYVDGEVAAGRILPENAREETLAYAIEYDGRSPLVTRVLSRIRQWLIKTFGSTFGMRLTFDDLRALALTSLRRAAEQARREGGEIVAVTPRPTTDAVQPNEGARFTTSRGSTYEVHADGTTTRNKAARSDPGHEGQQGPQPRSTRTIYVTNDVANALAPPKGSWRIYVSDRGVSTLTPNESGAARALARGETNLRARIHYPDGRPAQSDGDTLASFGARNVLENRPLPLESPAYQERLGDVQRDLRDQGLIANGRASGEADSARGGARQNARGADGTRDPGSVQGERAEPGRDRAGGEGRGKLDPGTVRSVLDVSGLRIQSQKDLANGEFMVTIDAPFKLEGDAGRAMLGDRNIPGEAAAHIRFDIKGPASARHLQIKWTGVGEGVRGTGAGSWLYRNLIDWAFDEGYAAVYSDADVSPQARRMYDALRRRGYAVAESPKAREMSDGRLVTDDFSPVFRVTRGESIPARDHAAPPPAGWMIDGLTLKERLDQIQARQEAYDKLSPAEQAIADDPDMMFSYGRSARERISAARLRDDARVEAAEAREMRQGYEAAARCAARHGAQSFITMGVTPAASASAGLGHVLGMTASIPLGVTVAPMIARAGNPVTYHTRRSHYAMNQARAMADEVLGSNDERFPVVESADLPAVEDIEPGDLDLPDESEGHVKPGQAVPPSASGVPKPSDAAMDTQDLIDLFDPIIAAEGDE